MLQLMRPLTGLFSLKVLSVQLASTDMSRVSTVEFPKHRDIYTLGKYVQQFELQTIKMYIFHRKCKGHTVQHSLQGNSLTQN